MFLSKTCTIEDCTKRWKLDGTESIKQLSGSTNINNGVMSGGSAFLLDGIDNTVDWKLELDVLFSSYGGCGVQLTPPSATSRGYRCLKINSSGAYNHNNDSYNDTSNGVFPTPSTDTWYSVVFRKQNNGISAEFNGTTINCTRWSYINNSQICVGVDYWSSHGEYCSIKNLRLKPL